MKHLLSYIILHLALGFLFNSVTLNLSAEELPELRVSEKDWAKSRAYRIDSDAPVAYIKELATTLDAMNNDFQRRFKSTQRIRQFFTVRFFHKKEDYIAYGKKYCNNFSENWKGYFLYASSVPNGEIVLYYKDNKDHLETAIHEGFHQFMHSRITNIITLPQWFNEGAAEYFELSEIKRNKLILPEKLSYQWIDELKTYTQKDELIPLEKLFNVGIKEWNNEHYENHYATSYAFIHYMVENDKKTLKQFSILLQALSKGIDYPTALENTYGKMDLVKLEAQFHEWLTEKIDQYESADK